MRFSLLLVCVCAASVFGQSDSPPTFPELTRLLSQPEKIENPNQAKAYRDELRKETDKIQSVRELEAALQLAHWGKTNDLPMRVREIHLEVLSDFADRFAAKYRSILTGNDDIARLAACTALALLGANPGPVVVGDSPTASWQMPPPGIQRALDLLRPDLIKVTQAKDAEESVAAVRTLGALPLEVKETVPALGKLLKDHKEKAVRIAAAESLGQCGGRTILTPDFPKDRPPPEWDPTGPTASVIEQLLLGLTHPDAEVRSAVFKSLQGPIELPMKSELKPRSSKLWQKAVAQAIPVLARQLTDESNCLEATRALERVVRVRRDMQWRMEKQIRDPAEKSVEDELQKPLLAIVPALAKNLAHKVVEVQLNTLYVLEALGIEAEEAIGEVVKASEDRNEYVRWGAVRVLGRLAPRQASKAVPALTARLKDDNGDVKATACVSLRLYGTEAKEAIPALVALAKGKDTTLRLLAVDALGAIGVESKEATAAFVECLGNADAKVRLRTVTALGKYKEIPAECRTALRQTLNDNDPAIRRAASQLLLRDSLK